MVWPIPRWTLVTERVVELINRHCLTGVIAEPVESLRSLVEPSPSVLVAWWIGCRKRWRQSARNNPHRGRELELLSFVGCRNVVLAIGLAGCERGHPITRQPIDLGSAPIRISMQGTGKSEGPIRQLCLEVA